MPWPSPRTKDPEGASAGEVATAMTHLGRTELYGALALGGLMVLFILYRWLAG